MIKKTDDRDIIRIGSLVKFKAFAVEAFTAMGELKDKLPKDWPEELRAIIRELVTHTERSIYEVKEITIREIDGEQETFITIESGEDTIGIMAGLFQAIQSPSEGDSILDSLKLNHGSDGSEKN